MRTVWSGSEPEGLTWRVLTGLTDDGHLMTQLYCDDGARVSSAGGFGGPPLWGDDLINHWWGHGEWTPTFAVVRTHPDVETVQVSTTRCRTLVIALSEVIPEFGVRFGAVRVPVGDTVAQFTATTNPAGFRIDADAPNQARFLPKNYQDTPAHAGGGKLRRAGS